MKDNEKEYLNKLFDEDNQLKPETIFVIHRRPKLQVSDDEQGMELNEGYDYYLNSPLPELADAIAKFAVELPNQGMGEGSDKYFVQLINEYLNRLSSTDVK